MIWRESLVMIKNSKRKYNKWANECKAEYDCSKQAVHWPSNGVGPTNCERIQPGSWACWNRLSSSDGAWFAKIDTLGAGTDEHGKPKLLHNIEFEDSPIDFTLQLMGITSNSRETQFMKVKIQFWYFCSVWEVENQYNLVPLLSIWLAQLSCHSDHLLPYNLNSKVQSYIKVLC